MKFIKSLTALCLSAVFLATPASAAGKNLDFSSLITATVADLQAADADALANKDVFADECYVGAIAYVQAHPLPLPAPGNPVGIVSAFQAGRDVVKGGQRIAGLVAKGIPPELVQACGPLALDVNNDISKATVGGFLGLFGG